MRDARCAPRTLGNGGLRVRQSRVQAGATRRLYQRKSDGAGHRLFAGTGPAGDREVIDPSNDYSPKSAFAFAARARSRLEPSAPRNSFH